MRFEISSIVLAFGFLGTANAYVACYSSEANCVSQCNNNCAYDSGVVSGLGMHIVPRFISFLLSCCRIHTSRRSQLLMLGIVIQTTAAAIKIARSTKAYQAVYSDS